MKITYNKDLTYAVEVTDIERANIELIKTDIVEVRLMEMMTQVTLDANTRRSQAVMQHPEFADAVNLISQLPADKIAEIVKQAKSAAEAELAK